MMVSPLLAQDRSGRFGEGLKGVPLRTRIDTPTGGLVVYNAPERDDGSGDGDRFLVYWHDALKDEVHVYGRVIETRSDLTHALLWLARDLGVDTPDLASRLTVDAPALPPGDSNSSGERRLWLLATRDRVMEIAGVWSPADTDPSIPPIVTAAPQPPCLPCAVAGGDVGEPPLAEGDLYEAAVAASCECCDPPHCPNCTDNNVCTVDYCNVSCNYAWCVNSYITCDDGRKCTIDGCNPQTGCYFNPKNCDDGDICTVDSCDPATGDCKNLRHCDPGVCCPNPPSYFCGPIGGICCSDHACQGDETCCGIGCCRPGQACCEGVCGIEGACCFFDTGNCSETTALCCSQAGGAFQGSGTGCSPGDLCRPQCENCHEINLTYFECAHTLTEPCALNACIEDIMTTATCDLFPGRLGQPKCDTFDSGVNGEVLQRLYYLRPPRICDTTHPGGFHPWTTTYQGCGTTCRQINNGVRCDTVSCAGGEFVTDTNVGFIHVCGCP